MYGVEGWLANNKVIVSGGQELLVRGNNILSDDHILATHREDSTLLAINVLNIHKPSPNLP